LAQYLSDLGSSRYERLSGGIKVANSEKLSPTEFARWVDAFNLHNGPGRLLWPFVKTMFSDSGRIYYVRFEKTGICKVAMFIDDKASGWMLFFTDNIPNVLDPNFSDRRDDDARSPEATDG